MSDRVKWKKPLGRPRLGWEDNIKVNNMKEHLRMDWIYLAQDAVEWQVILKTAMRLRLIQNGDNMGDSYLLSKDCAR